MADFNVFLNRQGIQGRKGDKGDTGFSPTISVGTDTLNEYKLIIANESNSFETPNLRGNINILDNGGTYLRYDTETQQISAQDMDAATADTLGGVRLSTEADIAEMGAGSVVTPSDVADALPLYLEGEGAVTITQDEESSKTKINVDLSSVDELKNRVSIAEAEIVGIQADVSNLDTDVSSLKDITASHTASISSINDNIANLNNNKVAKTDFATTESAGIVKVDGTTIISAEDGTISANSSYTLPTASTTQLGGVKVDGTSIIADENGVISSVNTGTGDVTSDGNNTFTGNNEFKKNVTITCSDSISNPTGLIINDASQSEGHKATFNVSPANGNLNVKTTQGAIELISPFATYIDGGQSSLSVHNNGITFTSNDVLKYYNNDGSYNYVPLVTQENIKAGENITLNKNAETGDITISSTASGGASIDDENISTTTVYSSDKTVNLATSLVDNAMTTLNQSKQDTLVSGTNIKTINGTSILGAGNITISGGGDDVPIATTEVAGKVKPDGTTITVTGDGTISANSSYTLPTASTTQLGGVKVDGTSVTINSDGVISATGGGSAPDNMVTTDTDQEITGKKTIVNSEGLCLKSTNSIIASVTGQIVNRYSSVPDTLGTITISPNRLSKFRYGFGKISYGILNDTNPNYPLFSKGGLQVTPVVDSTSAEARILLGSPYNGMGNIVGTTSGLTIGTGAVGSELSITSTDITFNGQSLLNSGGEVPTNMVTTDTNQIITGAKTFTNPITFNNTLNMSTSNTDTLYIHSSGTYAQGYTTNIDYHKHLKIKGKSGGGTITLAPYNGMLNALKYQNSGDTSNTSYDILHTGNLVTGNNITIGEPNSTGVRTISGPSNEYMASMAFPSSKYVDLELGASGSTYTAPANGWFVCFKGFLTTVGFLHMKNSANGLVMENRSTIKGTAVSAYVPVQKGQSIQVYYDAVGTDTIFRFIYAEGSK